MTVRWQHHFQWERHMQETHASRAVKSIDSEQLGRALFEQRARRWMLDPAGGVVTDFRRGVLEGLRTKSKKVSCYNRIIGGRDWIGGGAVGNNFAQPFFTSIPIMPKGGQGLVAQRLH